MARTRVTGSGYNIVEYCTMVDEKGEKGKRGTGEQGAEESTVLFFFQVYNVKLPPSRY
jgi:hypothetical protein